jgi:MFS family permease
MLLSTVGCAVSLVLLVVSPALPMLAISRFLFGFAYGGQQIMAAPITASLVDRSSATRFFATVNVVSSVAGAGGNFLAGYLPALTVTLAVALVPNVIHGPQSPFAYGAALVVAAAITLVSVVPFHFIHRRRVAVAPMSAVVAPPRVRTPWRSLVFMSLPMLLFGFTGGLTFPFYSLFFRVQFALPDDAVGTILSLGWLGMAFTPMFNPWWERRLGRARALGVTMTIAACGFFVLGLTRAVPLSILAYAIGVSFRNTMMPMFTPLVLHSLPNALHNNASGMSMGLWNVGWLVATAISGFWQTTYGFGFIMQVVGVGVLLTGVSVLLIFRKAHATQPDAMPA